MPLDPDKLLNLHIPEVRHTLTWRDTIIYALGLGYGANPLDEEELKFVDETKLKAVPAMANVLAYPGFWIRDLDTGIDWVKVVHGEQSVRILRPLPTEGTLSGQTRVVDLVDKGEKGALVISERAIVDEASGETVATIRQTGFCRGAGGFGGKRESDHVPQPIPNRPPDESVTLPTADGLALIYRLSGDYNPLHADPEVAKRAGFPKPILHGLATFGIACRGLMQALCDNEPERVRGQDGRFSSPVYPGDAITVDMWREEPGVASYVARVAEREVTVLANGRFEYDAVH
ncbi:MaoC/PaaZ C-terminal domain-containing protein [Acuticoccus sp.]|uniref:MaoC/PaaZ C-terminal domain-containing protein n=1 Tax=Acuticoccus sp. TaxID=1904378 RepID=UPI003B51E9C0